MKIFKYSMILSSLCLLTSCSAENEMSEIKDIQDIRTIALREDGRYDVICKNSSIEIATVDEIRAGRVCGNSGPQSGSDAIRISDRGLLEYFHSNEWRGVCDDNFGVNEAQVACRQLGGDYISHQTGRSGSSSSFWLDNLSCQGDESRLDTCEHNAFGSEDCGSDEWVQLKCSGLVVDRSNIRLASGGLIEVLHNDEWRGVCDDSFDANDGMVACRQLGLNYVRHTSGMSGPSGAFWLDNLNCSGNENSLFECSANSIGSEDCGSDEWVRLICN